MALLVLIDVEFITRVYRDIILQCRTHALIHRLSADCPHTHETHSISQLYSKLIPRLSTDCPYTHVTCNTLHFICFTIDGSFC